MRRARTHRYGFSLLELSIVLGIISLIAGAGVSLASGALKAADRVATQERLATIKLALDSYGKNYGYLPCPADRTLKPSSGGFGKETRFGSSTCSGGIVTQGYVYIGAVPVRTLGLPDNYASDAWGDKLTYAVTLDHVKDAYSFASTEGAITIRFGDRNGGVNYPISSVRKTVAYTSTAAASSCGAGCYHIVFQGLTDTGGLQSSPISSIVYALSDTGTVHAQSYVVSYIPSGSEVEVTSDVDPGVDGPGKLTWLAPGPGASYVVVSHGPDGRGAIPTNATAVVKPCTGTGPPPCRTAANDGQCIDIENCNYTSDSNNVFYDTTYDDGTNPDTYFDDYIVWGTNAGARSAVNANAYPTCNPGNCETWCAQCGSSSTPKGNYPGPFQSSDMAIRLDNPVLCSKVLYSAAATCNASCFWSGVGNASNPDINIVGHYVKCP